MQDFNRLYIIDQSQPFTGSVINSMTCLKQFGEPKFVDYMETETTFEDYKKQKGNENLKVITDDELDLLLNEHRKNLCESWTEITEKQYYDMLECVPPLRWRDIDKGINVFAVGECFTMDLYTHCIHDRVKNKYYSALRPIRSTDIFLLNDYLNLISC